jgi:hypothetical protein
MLFKGDVIGERALRNLADGLTPDDALCLGVNGAAHFRARWRQVLPEFGFKMTDLLRFYTFSFDA